MKRVFLLMVIPALLVALGLAQTPAPSVNTDQTTIKGCLGGSDGNYTVVQDNTGRIFKITTNSVDLKPHVGHDVTLIGQRTSGVSPAAADNSFAVTQLNMISEHCAAAVAAAGTAPAATVSAPPGSTVTPAATTNAPAATVTAPAAAPTASVTAPAETAATPSETVITPAAPAASATPAETAVTPAADATATSTVVTPPAESETAVAPAATVSTPLETASTPKADAAQPTHLRAHSGRRSAPPAAAAVPPAATASSSSEAATPSAPDATPPAAIAKTSAEPVSAPVAVAATPASHGSLWLLISLAVLVIVIGVMVPSLSRWRKRKSLERTGAPNLSLTPVASSVRNKPDQPRKAA
jgi:hypothetical protein